MTPSLDQMIAFVRSEMQTSLTSDELNTYAAILSCLKQLREAQGAIQRAAYVLQMDWDNADGVCGDEVFAAQLRALVEGE